MRFLLFLILCSHPGYFGKVGMRHFHLTKNQYFCPVVNVERLWSLIPQQTKKELPTKEPGNIPVLDVLDYVSVSLCACVCVCVYIFIDLPNVLEVHCNRDQ